MVRDVRASDAPAIRSLFARMSPLSIRHRYFVAKRELVPSDLAWLGRLDDGRTEAAVAVVSNDDGQERLIGIGRYALIEPHLAEVAFEVGDADQGHGIGTLLLDQLVDIARAHAITVLRAEVENDNRQMLDVLAHSGLVIKKTVCGTICRVDLTVADTGEDQRACAATSPRA
ncbi:MAG: GNAT family N-acetyltransferase [Deltaproteobacteria bacterium]